MNKEVAQLIQVLIQVSRPKDSTYVSAYNAYVERLEEWMEREGHDSTRL